jgi:hypothetical protein
VQLVCGETVQLVCVNHADGTAAAGAKIRTYLIKTKTSFKCLPCVPATCFQLVRMTRWSFLTFPIAHFLWS